MTQGNRAGPRTTGLRTSVETHGESTLGLFSLAARLIVGTGAFEPPKPVESPFRGYSISARTVDEIVSRNFVTSLCAA